MLLVPSRVDHTEVDLPMGICVVADDERAVREFVTRVLSAEGFDVFAAGDGRTAAALLAAHPVDLLVTDVVMPDGEGLETIRAVRRQYPGLKILVMSGKFGPDVLRMAKLLGADASLSKPFSAEDLLFSVRAIFES